MEIKACAFVYVSEVFNGCQTAWNVFLEQNNYPFSWGDNNRSLIIPARLIDTLEDIDCDIEWSHEVETVIERLKSLPWGIYVDLEN